MIGSADRVFDEARAVFSVPGPIPCADWCDAHFKLAPESSNTRGDWITTPVQRAILNAMGSDAIEKVDFFKSARFGGTKMLVGSMAYMIAHKMRNCGIFRPTKGDSDKFVKTEINPAIRDCEPWRKQLLSDVDKSPLNTLDLKQFVGCSAHFKGGHSGNAYRSTTLDWVALDELSGFNANIDGEGDPTTLSWGRVKNSFHMKQVQISTPTLSGFCLIEKSAKTALDTLRYHARCPRCHGVTPVSWGGKDVPFGFKWEGRNADTVVHICPLCAQGWGNGDLEEAVAFGVWRGERGYETKDGLVWLKDGEPIYAPRHVAFKAWSAYSPFSQWAQIVEEWYDAYGDFGRMQSFTNTTLGETWELNKDGTITAEFVNGLIPTDSLDDVRLVTAGIDIQDDRIEVMFMGHEHYGGMTVLDYEIHRGDMSQPAVYVQMAKSVLAARFLCGSREMKVLAAAVDTQGHHTTNVHKFLQAQRRDGVFFGVNGTANNFEIADKPGKSKGHREWIFYSIGTNVLKQKIFSAIRNFDQERGAFKIHRDATLPDDFGKQLVAERMEVKRVDGRDVITFTNPGKLRNEALDTAVYNLAARAFVRRHRGTQGRLLLKE